MAWSEDGLHRWLARRAPPRGLVGALGHDASVLTQLRGRPVVCVDQTIEGVHFEPDADPVQVGAKAVARSLSDLAATAARPRAVWLAVSAPRARDEAWLRALVRGALACARRYGADLYGGDLAACEPQVHVAVTALGEIDGRRPPPSRARARPGQVVVLTGPVGGSRLGRHLAIEPRIAAGSELHVAGATALIDVSDGLAWDVFRLARSAGVRVELDLDLVPIHRDAHRAARASGRAPLDHALGDGEDHELVATLAPRALARLRAHRIESLEGLVAIGRVVPGSGLDLVGRDGASRRWQPGSGGWRHGD